MAHSERMSPVDATWLRMDRPTNLMVILGVMKLAGPVKPAALEKALGERLLAYRRFRQKAEQRPGGVWWVDDRHFDLSRHMHHVRLPGAAGDAELEHFVGELASVPLDPSIPLWQFHIVEKFQGGAAVVARIHHAVADGIALMGVMLSLTDEMHAMGARGPQPDGDDEVEERAIGRWFAPLGQAIETGASLSRTVIRNANALTSDPVKAIDLVKGGASVAAELTWLLTMPNDTQTILKGKPEGSKRVAWTSPMPIADIKAVGHALGCSVNDILLSSVAGAIRAYLADCGEPVDDVEIRAVIPVNLRKDITQIELGNAFGLVALELPVGIANPIERVFEVRRRMNALKQSTEAPVTFGLLSALGYAPKLAQDMLFDLLLGRTTAVMTNVPGPQFPLSIAGARMNEIMFWVPQACDVGMGVSVLSYNGNVQFGLITDAALTPEPRRIIEQFAPQFEALLYMLLMGDGAGDDPDGDDSDSVDDEPAPPRKPRALAPKRARAAPSGRRPA